jgi:2-amino-4-hydroxy-6-hydroxymethyldihydropteridine diphosphokinase
MTSAERDGILSLGSNLGDREATILDAVRDIRAIDGVTVVAVSTLVQTPALKPHGVDITAPAYLNAAVAIRTSLAPEEFLAELAAIERTHGRIREERWGDRTLDIDIVTLGDITQSSDVLTLPHPRAATRAFVLAPWLELDPDAVLLGHGRIDSLLAGLDNDAQPYVAERTP